MPTLVFAQELNEVLFVNEFALSRLGALIKEIFIVGVSVEGYYKGNFYVLKIADPTGFFTVLVPKEFKLVTDTEHPVFFAILGNISYMDHDKSRIPCVIAKKVNLVEKRDRDAWLVETTRRTLERIKTIKIAEEFSGDLPELKEVLKFYNLPTITLEGIKNLRNMDIKTETERYIEMLKRVMESMLLEFIEPIEKADKLREEILEIITRLQNQNGVEIERLKLEIDEDEEEIDNCINKLLSEGLLYEPRIGRVKKID